MARVKLRGMAAVDRRSSGYRALMQWRSALVADLGGEAALSAQQRALVEIVVRSRLMLETIDTWIVAQRALVRSRPRGTGLPIMRDRQDLADSIARVLGQLGLERQAPAGPSLREVIEGRTAEARAARGEAPAAPADVPSPGAAIAPAAAAGDVERVS